MEFINFDFGKIIFSILILFFGCSKFNPPPPITITTPKIVITEKKNFDPGTLIFDISNDKLLVATYIDQDKVKKTIEIKQVTQQSIEKTIQQAINWVGGKEKIKIAIKNSKKSGSDNFKILIDALRAKKIYKYQLLTTPR